jgi:predicted  nucleic acid-binding Zn-ribbon protein
MNTQETEPIIKLSEKIDSLTVTIQDGFTKLNDRLDNVESRLCKVEDNLLNLDKRLIVVETNTTAMEKRMGTVENKLPDISEKFGELKNWRQISFVIIAAIAGWFVRGGKF